MAVQDSREWQRTSKPELALTAAGMVAVLRGSQIPSVGLRFRCALSVLACLVSLSLLAVPVVSLPVPAVVGMAMRGFSGLSMGRPLPRGALTKSRKSASGYEVYRFMSLAVSMTEPPPTARKASGSKGLAQSMASRMLGSRRRKKAWGLVSGHHGLKSRREARPLTNCPWALSWSG